jgi:hypothetical protein
MESIPAALPPPIRRSIPSSMFDVAMTAKNRQDSRFVADLMVWQSMLDKNPAMNLSNGIISKPKV